MSNARLNKRIYSVLCYNVKPLDNVKKIVYHNNMAKKTKTQTDLTEWLAKGNKVTVLRRNQSAIPKTKKKQEKRRQAYSKKRLAELTAKALELESNLPKSEAWFREQYTKQSGDKYNEVFKCRYIPDVINKRYKYVIEIDGDIHNTPEQIAKDAKKDIFYKSHDYTVIRIKAYDEKSLYEAMQKIKSLTKGKK